jgi:hypothetical protein
MFVLSHRGETKKVFANSPKGFEQLVTWLKNRTSLYDEQS